MRQRHVLITGATGILGSWVLAEALDRGVQPIVLMRDATEADARARLRAVLALPGEPDAAGASEVLLGDTTEPGLGLNEATCRKLLGRLDAVIHCAASTSFSPHKDAAIEAANVSGTRHMAAWLRGSGVPLYHVSTAYVAGRGAAYAPECDTTFATPHNNTYERTKRAAERLVQSAFAAGELRGAIFRPSIIVGASRNGAISQFLNFYSILRIVDLLERDRLGGVRRIRLQGNPDATVNLVPVDWAASALWRIIDRDGAVNRTYHLTHPAPCAQRAIAAWAGRRLARVGASFQFARRLDAPIPPAEQQANEAFQRYRGYLLREPVFDRSNTDAALGTALPTPEANDSFFDMLLAYARERRWQGVFGCTLRGVCDAEAPPARIDSAVLECELCEETVLRTAV